MAKDLHIYKWTFYLFRPSDSLAEFMAFWACSPTPPLELLLPGRFSEALLACRWRFSPCLETKSLPCWA